MVTFDVGEAFLNAQLNSKGKEDITFRLSKPVGDILTRNNSWYGQYLCTDGYILARLKKALYAPIVWFETIRAFLNGPDRFQVSNSPKLSEEDQTLLYCTIVQILFYAARESGQISYVKLTS